MFTLHLLGYVHASDGLQPLQLSSKAVALLSYLALEKRSHHREHLAGLLWDTPDALRNLRVELARLKSRGVNLFPARQPMLTLNCTTDLGQWLAAPHPVQERDLIAWLSPLNGPALSGLEDLGTSAFQSWVDQQRQAIHDRIEERLQVALSRYEHQRLAACAELVRARAELLGLELSAQRPPTCHTSVAFEWPAQEEQLRQVLIQAKDGPHLVLLQGYSETRRDLLRQMIQDTPWTAVQLQVTAQQPLLLAALTHHLWQTLPAEQRGQSHSAHRHDPETDLIELGQLMVTAGKPLLIALHDVPHPAQWPDGLESMLGFLLDLPLPLVLVLSTVSPGVARSLRPVLGQLAGTRLHTVTLPPVSVQDMIRLLNRQDAPGSGDGRRAYATRLVQRSEGIPMYIRALLGEKDCPVQNDVRLPEQVRDRLLAHLSAFPAPVHKQLARLAQIHGRFDLALADALVGQAAPEVLRMGLMTGLLVPAAASEKLILPDLTYRSSDAEDHVIFVSEALRSALAASLPAAERHILRATLATLLMPSRPTLGLVCPARTELPELPETACRTCTTLVGEPEALLHDRHEICTPNGYRVGLDSGYLEVLRRGPPGPPPLLTLMLPGQGAGRWTLTARVDVTSVVQPGAPEIPFALGVQTGAGPRVVYATDTVPGQTVDSKAQRFGGLVPLGHWFSLSGQGEGGLLGLSVRAGDIALTVGALRWGDHTLRDLCRTAFLD